MRPIHLLSNSESIIESISYYRFIVLSVKYERKEKNIKVQYSLFLIYIM